MKGESEEKERGYTTISIAIEMAERIDKVVEKGDYSNRPDFVRDAVRRLLEEKGV